MLDKKLLEILACPVCKRNLEYDEKNERLLCHVCRLKYKIEEGIPVMLVDEAEKF